MSSSRILQQISKKESDKEKIAARVIKQPELLAEILEGLNADKARIKYGCEKILRLISEKQPSLLYAKFDFFAGLLDSNNNFLQWGGIHVIANLARVDSKNRIERIFDKYFAPIAGPVLITAANVINGAAKIALAKPKLTEKITAELLKVEQARYQTFECRNVALGHVIKSFDLFFDQIKNKESVVKLVKRQLENPRNATRKKAEAFMKKHKLGIS